MTLDTLIPLRDAARKFGLAEASLRALVDRGKIRAGMLPNKHKTAAIAKNKGSGRETAR